MGPLRAGGAPHHGGRPQDAEARSGLSWSRVIEQFVLHCASPLTGMEGVLQWINGSEMGVGR